MRLHLLAVGKPRGPLAAAIADYESRVRHYFRFEAVEVREQPFRQGARVEEVVQEEGRRLLGRLAPGHELVALHREGKGWSSERLAAFLTDAGVNGVPGISFAIGGAFGLSPEVLDAARRHMSLSELTLPHELARLVLAEQLYRAGTIARGEPYHKGPIR
jgi:23S rRNA (pseudouridine1915-N3)-methyltransferase